MTWLLLGGQALISSSGLLMLRYAMPLILDKTKETAFSSFAWAGFGMLLYGASFLLWLYILSRHPVSFAYPVTIGLTLAITVVGSSVVLGEKIGVLQFVGIALMAVAVWFLSVDSPSAVSVSTDIS